MSKLFDRVLDAKVSRRDFLKGSAAATAAVVGLSLAGCNNNTIKESENETTKAPETTAPIVVEHDEIVDLEAKGKWVPAACWNNCGGRCLNKALVVDGVVMRQKSDDTHEDTPDYLQQRACVRGRARRAEVYSPDRLKTPMKRKNWQPGGVEVNGHLRGMDEWEPITWEEAFKIVASETKRIGDTYGPGAIFVPSAGNGANYVMYKAAGGYYGASGTLSWGTWNEGPGHFGMEDGYSSWSLNDRLDLNQAEKARLTSTTSTTLWCIPVRYGSTAALTTTTSSPPTPATCWRLSSAPPRNWASGSTPPGAAWTAPRRTAACRRTAWCSRWRKF